jgi:hypothetical protein
MLSEYRVLEERSLLLMFVQGGGLGVRKVAGSAGDTGCDYLAG